MKQLLSPTLVKNSLSSHSWLGLLVGVLMYLVCLSGTLAVFYQEFERWEQPLAPEYSTIAPENVQRAYEEALGRTEETEHMFLGLPSESMPRTTVSSDNGGWFVNQDGSLGDRVDHEWTHLLLHLHLYLHFPHTFGMVVVSILGALLCGLIISGFLAHPRIFRDAFTLRLKGSRHLEQADIHNRLSVWGAPFHLMIGITGAYFGLATIVGIVVAAAFFDGDLEAIVPAVFGDEPALEQSLRPAAVDRALGRMPEIAPESVPFYVTVEDVGTPQQFFIVGGRHSGRLIYAEQYRFDSSGDYLGKVGFSDGEPGRQGIFSLYRLHFGHFAGFTMKVLYGVFGLALTVVSVTGINIWFARRRRRDALNNLWIGLVWGAAPALALPAVTQIAFGLAPVWLFWAVLALSAGLAQWLDDDRRGRRVLQLAGAATLLLLVVVHIVRFGVMQVSPAAIGTNITLLLIAAVLGWMARASKPVIQPRMNFPDRLNSFL